MNQQYEKGCAIAKSVSDMLNITCHEDMARGFVEELLKDHRSLQYNEIKLFAYMLARMSEVRTDARNELAVKFARFLTDAAKKEYGEDFFDDERYWIS